LILEEVRTMKIKKFLVDFGSTFVITFIAYELVLYVWRTIEMFLS